MAELHPDFLGEVARRAGLTPHVGYRQLVVQHLYPDTLRLLLTSHRYVPIDVVIGIGYSGRPEVVAALRDAGIRVLTPPFDEIDAVVRRELGDSLARARRDGVKLILHEVGGYAITSLHRDHLSEVAHVRGAVEITKQGVWAARRLPELRIPQLNCAETRLKELEGPMVGEAVVHSIDHILRDLGRALAGRTAVVLGYGWVGRGVCRSLRAANAIVAAHDTDVIRRVAAKLEGFSLLDELGSLRNVSLVVGAAGARSIGPELLDRLPDGVFLASGSSKDIEIDVAHLRAAASRIEPVHAHVEAFQLPGRTVYLMNRGYPVNFTGASVPDEVVEFLLAEALLLLDRVIREPHPPGTFPLPPELEEIPAQVWLDLR